jgi:asparagine synthase (glutamine-hydrolysing)
MISAEPLSDARQQAVRRMQQALFHRGPDGEGIIDTPHAALAMRRLAIIDINASWQPLYNEDKSLALVVNGEIYNYIELRDELRARGHSFATGGDCEVILHLYEEYGVECVKHLRGMFAFAIWDAKAKTVFLARDRMGEKPLYLWQDEGILAFSSELPSLVRCGEIPYELDMECIADYLHYGFMVSEATPVKNVKKLQPGTACLINCESWAVRTWRYWRMTDSPELNDSPHNTLAEEVERVGEICSRADVPIGLGLSGGVDSSIVAYLLKKYAKGDVHAFTVGYSENCSNDERAVAKELADKLGLIHHAIELDTAEVVADFPALVSRLQEPIADVAFPSYDALVKAARDADVPVLLLGHGTDELLWGYNWIRDAVAQSRRKQLLLREGLRHAGKYLSLKLPHRWRRREVFEWLADAAGMRSSVRALLEDWRHPNRAIFSRCIGHFEDTRFAMRSCLGPALQEALSAYDPAAASELGVSLEDADVELEIPRILCDTYLVENGIALGDRLSMAHSVELRLPFVDYRLVETIIGARKVAADTVDGSKSYFTDIYRHELPAEIFSRQKLGYTPPVGAWLEGIFAEHGGALEGGELVQQGILTAAAGRRLRIPEYKIGVNIPFCFKAIVLEFYLRYLRGVFDTN